MAQQQSIDISQLSIEQLNSLKQQIEEEAQFIQQSIQQLKLAASKFQDSKDCLATLKKENDGIQKKFEAINLTKGKQVLVPMTASMYVPATLIETDHVLVDIGTGYYIKKSVKGAGEFCDRKVKLINENIDKLTRAFNVKRGNLEAILNYMQQRIAVEFEQVAKEQAEKEKK